MKPIKLTEDMKLSLFEQFLDKFKKEVDDYAFGSADGNITIKTNFNQVAADKIVIRYTQEAFLRMRMLVDYFDTEVGWYGLCKRLDEKTFRVYGVKLCKQYVTGSKVDTEDEDTLEFFNSLTDDEAEHMHFQAHSHVRMGTTASGTDLQNQADVVHNIGKTGYYIFQIWNKNDDINTYLYDLDNNVFYDRKDIVIEIEDSAGTINDFILSVLDLVEERKVYQWNNNTNKYPAYNQTYNQKNTDKKEKKEKKEEQTYMQEDYGYNYERWDW